MSIIAGSTARGFPYPGHAGSADGPTALKALADAIEAEFDDPSGLTLGGPVTAPGPFALDAAGAVYYKLRDSTAGVDVKRSTLRNGGGTTQLRSVNDADTAFLKTGLTFDHATGVVDHPNGLTGRRVDSPYFRAYRSTAASYATDATVIFNAETADPNGWYDPATGIFLPTVAGTYRLSWVVALAASMAVDRVMHTFLFSASNADLAYSGPSFQAASGYPVSAGGTALLAFNGTTDAVHVVIGHNNGGTVAVQALANSTHFEAEYIGA